MEYNLYGGSFKPFEGSIEIRQEEDERLSPLVHEHINVLGHYSFTLAESVLKGERPLLGAK